MANLTYANLFSEARNNIVSLISDSSNVPDPIIGSSQYRKWIYAREPDVKSGTFEGYPYIIIHAADCDIEEDGGSTDGKSRPVTWDVEIEIVTSDRGYGNNDGKGLTHMDSISNNIMKTLLDATNRNTLRSQGMKNARPITSKVVPEVRHDELCFVRSIIVQTGSRMQVSA